MLSQINTVVQESTYGPEGTAPDDDTHADTSPVLAEGCEPPDALAAAVITTPNTAADASLQLDAPVTAAQDNAGVSMSRTSTTSSTSSSTVLSDPAILQSCSTPVTAVLPADTADEVQLMAAQVLQRKQNPIVLAPTLSDEEPPAPDPLQLLKTPERNLRARKERLMLANAANAGAGGGGGGGSARVAAAKEELAGVQARLRDALGLRVSASEELHHYDFYEPLPLKRMSYGIISCSSYDSTVAATGGGMSDAYSKTQSSTGSQSPTVPAPRSPAAAHLPYKKSPRAAPGMQAPAASAAAKTKQAASPPPAAAAAELPQNRIYFDNASEVAEMAARLLKRHTAAAE